MPMASGTLLIIDDDRKLIELVREYMSEHGWHVVSAGRAEEGLRLLRTQSPRLVILDVMLPEKDGFEICREIRATSQIPIIMLTARGELTDRIVGLELGADDYLPKPFAARELLARIQSVLRRSTVRPQEKADEEPLRFGRLEIDAVRRTVQLGEEAIDLTTAEFDVLALLAKHPGKVFERGQVMDLLRGVDWQAFNRSIDILVSRVRHKLHDDAKRPRFIKTVWGVGYVFVGKAERE